MEYILLLPLIVLFIFMLLMTGMPHKANQRALDPLRSELISKYGYTKNQLRNKTETQIITLLAAERVNEIDTPYISTLRRNK